MMCVCVCMHAYTVCVCVCVCVCVFSWAVSNETAERSLTKVCNQLWLLLLLLLFIIPGCLLCKYSGYTDMLFFCSHLYHKP